MAEFTFFAKPDGSSANNSSLNIDPPKGQTTEITFLPNTSALGGGDVFLDDFGTTDGAGDIIDDGTIDPNTQVYINGDSSNLYTFEVEFSGTVNVTTKATNNGIAGEQFTIITIDPGGLNLRLVFFPNAEFTQAQAAAINNGAYATNAENNAQVEICFRSDMRVMTNTGYRKIGSIRPGDLVQTIPDGGFKTVRWVGGFQVTALDALLKPDLRPVRIHCCSGPQCQSGQLVVSQQHRIELADPYLELLFGIPEVFVPAHWLLRSGHATRVDVVEPIEYVHLLLDSHEVLCVEGYAAESLYFGKVLKESPDPVLEVFSEQVAGHGATIPKAAILSRSYLRYPEFELLVRRYPEVLERALMPKVLTKA
ncbi:Hint domain-containing protein [Pontivivens insulae]|uniref:Hedgehog/Intein (Hint) domain-containing protein n=1 Tax=Pontivivens insulae TaxID=1639689 RepID=A0A2R8AEL2_9RHOB|nr:Hint domain-containing protein [Pontivivens insulae]RED11869.1 Hint domain-containing protein [Pontivivens insulae]SPF30626.1 hypothetical protein POI8812_02966 [Pontivivens insulae]